MSERRFTDIWCSETGHIGVTDYGIDKEFTSDEFEDFLNELNDENQLLKCALALDAITNISLNDKKVDIPPYYEFENYQQLKKERREEYDEYW